MTAERSCATSHDGIEYLTMLPANPPPTLLLEGLSTTADDVGHLERWPAHSCLARCPCSRMVSASRGLAVTPRCLLDKCR